MTSVMRNIYLAAPFGRQSELREYRNLLQAIGHTVKSTWLDEQATSDKAVSPAYLEVCAQTDLADLLDCDTVIVFSNGIPTGAGNHTEFGIAYQSNMHIILVGPPSNIFHYLPSITRVPDFTAAIEALK